MKTLKFIVVFLIVSTSLAQQYFKHPTELLNAGRFSVMAKYIYAKNVLKNKINSVWPLDLYTHHLMVWNQAKGDPGKNCLQNYLTSFDILYNSLVKEGFDVKKPIDVGKIMFVDGEHRVAICLLENILVPCRMINHITNQYYSAEYFEKKGLRRCYLDAMALEYSKLKINTYIVTLFSRAYGKNDVNVKKILNKYGEIVYNKNIIIENNGAVNLIRMFYNSESWVGNYNNDFVGAQNKAKACFNDLKKSQKIKIFLWECGSLEQVKECKKDIRSLFSLENDSVHINDTHQETVLYAQTFFNENSIHFLNNARRVRHTKFIQYLSDLKKILYEKKINQDDVCVDSGGVLAAYGLRECGDLDVFHYGHDSVMSHLNHPSIESQNNNQHLHSFAIDDIVFNPNNHFYYEGIKFSSLAVVKNMKINRNAQSDQRDIVLINSIHRK